MPKRAYMEVFTAFSGRYIQIVATISHVLNSCKDYYTVH